MTTCWTNLIYRLVIVSDGWLLMGSTYHIRYPPIHTGKAFLKCVRGIILQSSNWEFEIEFGMMVIRFYFGKALPTGRISRTFLARDPLVYFEICRGHANVRRGVVIINGRRCEAIRTRCERVEHGFIALATEWERWPGFVVLACRALFLQTCVEYFALRKWRRRPQLMVQRCARSWVKEQRGCTDVKVSAGRPKAFQGGFWSVVVQRGPRELLAVRASGWAGWGGRWEDWCHATRGWDCFGVVFFVDDGPQSCTGDTMIQLGGDSRSIACRSHWVYHRWECCPFGNLVLVMLQPALPF